MNQLNAIRVFVRVVQLGGFTKAAKSLGIPKTTASKLIGDLEAHLKVKLLKRSTRSVQVTVEGAAYYAQASGWLEKLAEIDSMFDSVSAELCGLVSVDASSWIASSVIIPHLPEFYAMYPSIEVDVSVGDRTAHLIQEKADCAIRGGPVNDLSMIARPLGQSARVTAATPEYLQCHGIPVHPNDLKERHVIVSHQLTGTGRPAPLIFQKEGKSLQIEVPAILTVNESNAHLAAGVAGIGLLYCFEWKLRPYLREGRLIRVLEDWQPPPYEFHLVYPPNRHMSARTRVFINWIADLFETLC